MNNNSFFCDVCQEYRRLPTLSVYSLDKAGTNNPRIAIKKLPAEDLLCSCCAAVFSEDDEDDAPPPRSNEYRYYHEKYPGVDLDKPTLDWLSLNY